MELELFCRKGFTGRSLKNKLEVALLQHRFPYQIKEVNNTEDFIKEGISNIPAIRVMNKVITHDEQSTIEETVKKVIDVLAGDILHHILVPVDFTPESMHALRYARIIASSLGLGITVAHIHEPVIDPITGSTIDYDREGKEQDQLEKMISKIAQDPIPAEKNVPIDKHFDKGDIKSNLLSLVENKKYDMVIMSTQAENTYLKRLFGSVSTHLSRQSSKPVIIVPIGAPLLLPKYIVVGVSYELFRDNAVDALLDFASNTKAFLDFVYLSNDLSEFNRVKNMLLEKLGAFNKKDVQFNISRASFGKEFIDEALTDYVNIKRADLVVLTTHYRSLIESIGHRSTSKKMLLDPALPVMILHSHHEGGLGITEALYHTIKEG